MAIPNLSEGYYLDRVTDPDAVILRCPDGSVVAVFSHRGAAKEEIERAAKEDTPNGTIESDPGASGGALTGF